MVEFCLTYIVITSSSVLLLIPRRDYSGVSHGLWELDLQRIVFGFRPVRRGQQAFPSRRESVRKKFAGRNFNRMSLKYGTSESRALNKLERLLKGSPFRGRHEKTSI